MVTEQESLWYSWQAQFEELSSTLSSEHDGSAQVKSDTNTSVFSTTLKYTYSVFRRSACCPILKLNYIFNCINLYLNTPSRALDLNLRRASLRRQWQGNTPFKQEETLSRTLLIREDPMGLGI